MSLQTYGRRVEGIIMKKPKEKLVKAAVHGFLAVLGAIEYTGASTGARKFLLGCAAGFHAHSTWYHLVLEKDEDDTKTM